jgi:uncharacterized protein YbjT (DUF2867 family)
VANILLTGANGNVASAAIRALQGSGHRLFGLVRNPAKAEALPSLGVELRVGDLERPRSLEGAFDGVDVALLLCPPGPLAPYHTSNALWAARQAGVKHVVRASAIGAAHDAPTLNGRLHALSDDEARASGMAYTILKPHFFMQNLMMGARSVAAEGTLYMALGDAKLPMIDVRDVGAVAAKVLAEPDAHAGKTYTLTGPAAVSLHDVAAALAQALGKPVKYVALPPAAMVENLAKMGVDDYNQVATRDYMNAYAGGWQSQATTSVKDILGRDPTAIAQFARDFAAAFGGAR